MAISEYVDVILVIIFVLICITGMSYFYKMGKNSTAAAQSNMSAEFNQRENFTSQPHRYRQPGYVRDAARETVPINNMEEARGTYITSTNPYWSYESTPEYMSLITPGTPSAYPDVVKKKRQLTEALQNAGWELYVLAGCGACEKQKELLMPYFGKECLGDVCPDRYPAWFNKVSRQKIYGYQPMAALERMAAQT